MGILDLSQFIHSYNEYKMINEGTTAEIYKLDSNLVIRVEPHYRPEEYDTEILDSQEYWSQDEKKLIYQILDKKAELNKIASDNKLCPKYYGYYYDEAEELLLTLHQNISKTHIDVEDYLDEIFPQKEDYFLKLEEIVHDLKFELNKKAEKLGLIHHDVGHDTFCNLMINPRTLEMIYVDCFQSLGAYYPKS